MPDKIKHLPQELINQIAAGEIVERPASVIKELIENSIDAASTHIVIKMEKGGTKLISVSDNGIGMSSRDAMFAFDRHATSKISSKDDLFNIHTLGFRGEALASIAAVARIRLKTRERDSDTGTYIEIEGGKLINNLNIGCPAGTEIDVKDLFFNIPVRKGFLKSPTTELGHIISIVTHTAVPYNEVHLTLINAERGNRVLLDFPPVKGIEERVFQIHGGDVLEKLVNISGSTDGCSIHGLVSKPFLTFNSKESQMLFVNNRSIRNPALSHAIQAAYLDLIPRDRHPLVFLFIDIDPGSIDVNVHPTKREVKFRESKYIHNMVIDTIRSGLKAKPITEVCVYTGEFGSKKYEVHEGAGEILNKEIEFHVQEISEGPYIRILGQIGALFIVAEIDGDLNIIDQHAAHERILYDRLKKGHIYGRVDSQGLLIPETVEMTLDKAQILLQYIAPLNRLGFDIEEMGDKSFMIRAIPVTFAGEDPGTLLTDMTEEIMEWGLSPGKNMELITTENIIKALLSKKACHSAVRAKGLLSNGEMSSLLASLLKTDMPYTCPHGRPVIKRFSSEELARMFDRK